MGFWDKLLGKEKRDYGGINDVEEINLETSSELSEELKKRVKGLLESGKNKKEIIDSLLSLGYSKKEINKLIISITKISKAEDLYPLTGQAFEDFLEKLFNYLGYLSIKTKTSGDQGGDLVLEKGKDKIVVQAKNFCDNLVSNKAIQEVFASKSYYNCNKAMVVTTSRFTKSAKELAEKNDIELWDKYKLTNIIKDTNFIWFPKETHLRKGERIKISGKYVENPPFSIKLKRIKQIGNVVNTNQITGHRSNVGELVKIGFEIKNISKEDWSVGSENSFLIDKSNKQHHSLKIGMSDDKEIYFIPYEHHDIYSDCILNFYLLFHKKALLNGVKRFVINICYTTPESYHRGSYKTENKIFKIGMD